MIVRPPGRALRRAVHPMLALLLLSSCASDPAPTPVPPAATPPAPSPPPPATTPPSEPPPPATASAPPATPPAVPTEVAAGPAARGAIAVTGATGTATLVGDQLSVTLTGSAFGQTCNDMGRVSVKEGGAWKPVPRDLPPKGNYVLDGRYVGYGMCDTMVCGAPHFNAELRKFQPSSDPGGRTAYASSPVTGSIKVEFTYFAEAGCKTPRTLTVTLER